MTEAKKSRHRELCRRLKSNPFLKDKELAAELGVSVATIRCDRAELGIAEYRERVKNAAEHGADDRLHTEVLELNLFKDGISILDTGEETTFSGTNIVKSQYIYAAAENMALSVVDVRAALVKVANVKYVKEVHAGEKLVAHAEVIRVREREYIVHVFIKSNADEVFRGKFSLSAI